MQSHCMQHSGHCSLQECTQSLALHFRTHRAFLRMTMRSESKPRAASHMQPCCPLPEEPSVKSLTQRTAARPITSIPEGTITLSWTLSGGFWAGFDFGTTVRGARVSGSKRNTSWWATTRRIPGREQSLEYPAVGSVTAVTTGSPTPLSPATLKLEHGVSDTCWM